MGAMSSTSPPSHASGAGHRVYNERIDRDLMSEEEAKNAGTMSRCAEWSPLITSKWQNSHPNRSSTDRAIPVLCRETRS